jgi:hypothetical protein
MGRIPDDIKNECGVYFIRHRVTGGTYVGASKKVRLRIIGHLTCMKCDACPKSKRYRDAFGGAGLDDLEIRVLEYVEPYDVLARELEWIIKLKPSVNQNHRVYYDLD